MERAIRRISVERGFDPRGFTLVPFGGAGPLHACDLAASLQIPRVFIPAIPGVLSALGMLVAAPTKDYSQTIMLPLPGEALLDEGAAELGARLAAEFAPLRERGLAEMAAEGYAAAELETTYELDVRYAGQSHELTVPFRSGEAAALPAAFHAMHERRYGYQEPARALELVTLRLTVAARVTPPVLPRREGTGRSAADALIGHKPVYFAGGPQETALYDRARLEPGHQFRGPAIIFQYDTTNVVPPGWQVEVDPWLNLVLTR
ncbi:MAG: hypothetical protein KDE59_12200, partial [Anaerolineales bacterium]|nr:hypothetical protein [Anaerolineales bacterium]